MVHIELAAGLDNGDGGVSGEMEPQQQQQQQQQNMDVTVDETTAAAAAASIDLALIDVVPCNLSSGSWFLRSRIESGVSRDHLRLFLYCYGFLLYDKNDKLALLRANTVDSRVRDVAAVLGECATLAAFKHGIHEQLRIVNCLLDDPATRDAMSAAAAAGAEDKLRILDVARQSLEYIYEFIRDSDHLRRSINANEYSGKHMFKPDERATRAIFDAWHDAKDCDLDRCVSVIFRDAVVSTGMQTRSTMLFVVRACLVLTFLVTNFMRGDARVHVKLPDTPDSATVADFWMNFGSLTVEKFIATTMVAMTRMFVQSCVNWPVRVRDSSVVSVAKFRARLFGKLSSGRGASWLRAMRRTSGSGATGGKRLYVRFEALLDLFDRMSAIVPRSDDGVAAAAVTDAAAPLRCEDRQLSRQWSEYESDTKLCSDALIESLRESGGGGEMSIERFVVNVGTNFRGRDDDLATAAAAIDGTDDEVELLSNDLARMFLFAALSLARHAPPGAKIYDESDDGGQQQQAVGGEAAAVNALEDDNNESFRVLLVHIASHLFRSRIRTTQTCELFEYIISVWRSHRGLVTLEQLSQILFTLYRMFQIESRAPLYKE